MNNGWPTDYLYRAWCFHPTSLGWEKGCTSLTRKQRLTNSVPLSSAHNARQSCGHWGDSCCQFLCIDEGLAVYLTAAIYNFQNRANQQPSGFGQADLLCLLLPDYGSTAARSLRAASARPVWGWRHSICSAAGWTLEQLTENSGELKSTLNKCPLWNTLRRIISSSTEFRRFLGNVVTWCSFTGQHRNGKFLLSSFYFKFSYMLTLKILWAQILPLISLILDTVISVLLFFSRIFLKECLGY